MNVVIRNSLPYITIHPGEFYVTKKHVIISTLLGSCIAACLYDPVNRVAGMNHFMLSNRRYSRTMPTCVTEAGRYGIHAMELLINRMLNSGATKKELRAKVFGGSSLLPISSRPESNFLCVGEVNCRFILEFLKNDAIPLIASDLGGPAGRVIRFSSSDYSVKRRRIAQSKISVVQKTGKDVLVKIHRGGRADGCRAGNLALDNTLHQNDLFYILSRDWNEDSLSSVDC